MSKSPVVDIAAPILEAPQDKSAWTASLDALREVVPCDLAGMVHIPPGASAGASQLLAGSHPELCEEYMRDFQRIDPFLSQRARERHRTADAPLFSEEIIPEAELYSSAFYNDYLRPRGDLVNVIGSIRELRDGRELHFGLLRRRGWRFDEAERLVCRDFLRLASAALIQRELMIRIDRERAIGLGFSENSGDALFVLDPNCNVDYHNAAAHSWVARDAVLSIQDGRLVLRHPEDAAWLRREARNLLPDGARNHGDSLRLRTLDSGPHGARLYAVLSRLPILDSPAGVHHPPRVALYLRCLEEAIPQLPPQVLGQLFALTTAESRVLNALLQGVTVEQMAFAWGIRGDTVRGHLKRILAKTGCSRQQELVQLASKALPHLALLNDHSIG